MDISITYSGLQEKVYQNKVMRNFNVVSVAKEIALMTEEFGELCDAYIEDDHPKIVDAIGDIMVYCLGLSAMFKRQAENIIDRNPPQPENLHSLLDYIPYVGSELGLLAKTYKKSNQKQVDELDRQEEFLEHIGIMMGYCHVMFTFINENEMSVLESIVSNNAVRTHQGHL